MLRSPIGANEIGYEYEVRLASFGCENVCTLIGLGRISKEIVDLQDCFFGFGRAGYIFAEISAKCGSRTKWKEGLPTRSEPIDLGP